MQCNKIHVREGRSCGRGAPRGKLIFESAQSLMRYLFIDGWYVINITKRGLDDGSNPVALLPIMYIGLGGWVCVQRGLAAIKQQLLLFRVIIAPFAFY